VNKRDWCFMWAGVVLAALAVVAVGKFNNAKAERWLVTSGYAFHLDGSDYCNEITAGLGLEFGERYSTGFYYNSNCRWSAYVGKAWTPLALGDWKVGGLVGGVTGYDTPIMPVGALFGSLEGKKYGLNLTYIPPFKDSGNVLWVQMKMRF
jgi:hypothetical protein